MRSIHLKNSCRDLFALLSAFVAFLCVVEITCLGLSVLHVGISRPVALATLVVGIVAAWATQRAIRRIDIGGQSEDEPALPSWVGRVVVFAVLVYLIELLIAVLVPDLSFDGNMYHFPTIHYWAQNGRVCWIDNAAPYSQLMNGYPKGAELLGFVLARASGLDNAANVVNLLLMPLGVLGIACLSRAMGASSRLAVLAGLLYILLPTNVGQSTTTYIDSAYASCVVAALAVSALVPVWSVKTGWRWIYIVPLGGAIGLMVSVRPTGVVLAAICLVCLAFSRRIMRRSKPKTKRMRDPGVAFLAGVICVVGLVGGFWYVRNFMLGSSPIYPVGVKIGPYQLFPGWQVEQAMMTHGNTPYEMTRMIDPFRVIYAWLQGTTYWPNSILGPDSRLGGLGFLWVLGCVPAVAFTWMRDRAGKTGPADRGALLRIGTALVVSSFIATPMHWWARYTTWLYALGLPCFALVIHRVYSGKQLTRGRRTWVAACIGVCVLEGGVSLVWSANRNVMPQGTLCTSLTSPTAWHGRYYACHFPDYAGTPLEDILDSPDAVAVGPMSGIGDSHKMCIFGWLSRPLGRRTIVPVKGNIGQGELQDMIRSKRIKWILWDITMPLPPAMDVQTPHTTLATFHLFRADQLGVRIENSAPEFPVGVCMPPSAGIKQ